MPSPLNMNKPKPRKEDAAAPIGEWTEERFRECGIQSETMCQYLADEITDALAAKDELHAAALQVLERHHQKQLAAEREAGQALIKMQARDQLAAEREKVQGEWKEELLIAYLDVKRLADDYEKQLAAAQAAMKRVHPWLSVEDAKLLEQGDTTALDAATKEAQQPLVDALKQCRELTTLRRIHQVVDAALAKVEEGK